MDSVSTNQPYSRVITHVLSVYELIMIIYLGMEDGQS